MRRTTTTATKANVKAKSNRKTPAYWTEPSALDRLTVPAHVARARLRDLVSALNRRDYLVSSIDGRDYERDDVQRIATLQRRVRRFESELVEMGVV